MLTLMLMFVSACGVNTAYTTVKRWREVQSGCPHCGGRLDRRAFRFHCADCGAIWAQDRKGLVPAAEFRGQFADTTEPPPKATARFRR